MHPFFKLLLFGGKYTNNICFRSIYQPTIFRKVRTISSTQGLSTANETLPIFPTFIFKRSAFPQPIPTLAILFIQPTYSLHTAYIQPTYSFHIPWHHLVFTKRQISTLFLQFTRQIVVRLPQSFTPPILNQIATLAITY